MFWNRLSDFEHLYEIEKSINNFRIGLLISFLKPYAIIKTSCLISVTVISRFASKRVLWF